jgi:hypothetical protein
MKKEQHDKKITGTIFQPILIEIIDSSNLVDLVWIRQNMLVLLGYAPLAH